MTKAYHYTLALFALLLLIGVKFFPQIGTGVPNSETQSFSAHMSCSGMGKCSVPPEQEIPIPAGKRAFLQYVSATASVEGIVPQQVMIRLTVPHSEATSTCSVYEYALPVTAEGVIGGKSQFSAAEQMGVIAAPPEQTCSVQKGIGAYIDSTSSSQQTALDVHISGFVR